MNFNLSRLTTKEVICLVGVHLLKLLFPVFLPAAMDMHAIHTIPNNNSFAETYKCYQATNKLLLREDCILVNVQFYCNSII